jgi:hypothetical protein
MRQPYFKLIFWLLLSAVVTFAVGLSLLNISQTADVDAEVGKWLLTVTAALVFTGALSMVVKQIDERRSQQQRWYGVLNDLGAANHTIAMLRLYLAAEQSALTYMEQLAELVRVRQELRRICAIDIVMKDEVLPKHIKAMQKYLEAVGQECEGVYLRVARQQRLDEVWLTDQMKAASVEAVRESADAPVLPDGLDHATTAWCMLARLPKVAALLEYHAFQLSAFCIHYELAKWHLEELAGFRGGSTDASAYWARELPGLAMEFLEQHKLADDVRTPIKEAACMVRKACAGTDPSAIQEATVKLCEATADAINVIYSSPEHNGTAAGEHKAHPAPSSGPPLP